MSTFVIDEIKIDAVWGGAPTHTLFNVELDWYRGEPRVVSIGERFVPVDGEMGPRYFDAKSLPDTFKWYADAILKQLTDEQIRAIELACTGSTDCSTCGGSGGGPGPHLDCPNHCRDGRVSR